MEMPEPDPAEIFDFAYAGEHSLVAEEKAAYLDYLDSFADTTDGGR